MTAEDAPMTANDAAATAASGDGVDSSSNKDKENIVAVAVAALAALVSRGVADSDKRLLARAARQTVSGPLRRNCTPDSILAFAVAHARPQAVSLITEYLGVSPPAATAAADHSSDAAPELDAVALLNTIVYFIDSKNFKKAAELGDVAVQQLRAANRRTLDALAARLIFYWALAHERMGNLLTLRSQLMAFHRTAVICRDDATAEVLVNLILRALIGAKLYDAADKFQSQITMPETRSNQQHSRYHFYIGQIRAIHLEYTDARENLAAALRKAPPNGAVAFRAIATKWLIVVRLLLGDIPERTLFGGGGGPSASKIQALLAPYLALAMTVRSGDLEAFGAAAAKHHSVFVADGVAKLVVRLRRSVIRTGLRRIHLAYSRISLADVAAKLKIADTWDKSTAAEVEGIVAKAVRDGGLDATLDHTAKILTSGTAVNIYRTGAPAEVFDGRINFTLDIHNDAVKAMRYPAKEAEKMNIEISGEKKVEVIEDVDDDSAMDEGP